MKSCFSIMCVSAALIFSIPANAQNHKENMINEKSVRDYSEAMNRAHTSTFPDYSRTVDTALSDDARFELHDVLKIPGQPPRNTDQMIDKRQYMADLKSGYDMLQGAKINYKISAIEISDDGRKAVLKDVTDVRNTLPAPGNSGSRINMEFTSSASCETHLELSPAGALQATKTICDSKTDVIPPDNL